MSTMISLRRWIEHALEVVDISGPYRNDWPVHIRRSLAMSSDSFLISALRVALSLADQLCHLGDIMGGHQLVPTQGADWADQAVVHLSTECQRANDPPHQVDVEPLPFLSKPPDPRELQDMLNSLIPDQSLYTREDDDEEVCTDEKAKLNVIPYHNVAWAEILPSPTGENSCDDDGDEIQRIYSLSVIFYEIFSGGERPPPTKKNNDETLSHYQASALDFSRRLSFSDHTIGQQSLEIAKEKSIPRKKKVSQTCNTLRLIRIEPRLKRKGVHISLCNLIGNMIDSMNRDLSRKC